MHELTPPPLSRLHRENLLSDSNVIFESLGGDNFNSDVSLSIQNSNNQSEAEQICPTNETDKADLSSLNCIQSFILPPDWCKTNAAVEKHKRKWETHVQLKNSKRLTCFHKHQDMLHDYMQQKQAESLQKMSKQAKERQQNVERKIRERIEKAKLEHQKRQEYQKKKDNRHREIEKEKEVLAEHLVERQKQRDENINKLQSLLKTVDENKKSFQNLYDNYPNKSLLPDTLNRDRAILEEIFIDLTQQFQTKEEPPSILSECVAKFEEQKTKSEKIVDQFKKLTEETNAKLKAAEEKQREEERKKAESIKQNEQIKKQQAVAETDFKVQAFKYILQEQSSKAKRLAEVEASIKPFIDNAQMKKYRFDLQRAVNTPINAISGISGEHLLDKLKKLHLLLSGQKVEVSGKYVCVRDAPEAQLFCENLIAKMLVKKGEEQVTSKHESVFAIAAVTVGLWISFPIIGELFIAHLQALCPYVLPYYTTSQDAQSNIEYYKSVGYKVNDDGSIEEQDKFLRRMSGLMRLYMACMVVSPPNLTGQKHPHGLEHAWMWLARTFNLEPHPDITAAMIFDVLSVTGHYLFKHYKIQFVKLLYVLYKNYLPTLKSISVTSATVGRLEVFLENSLQTASIPIPDGALSHNFWSTS
ncbi:Nuclear pore complex nucleoporin component [Bulinus truncatus]|nr:Nuclear pore complex nucleoporin component [Bulinus truncatus]